MVQPGAALSFVKSLHMNIIQGGEMSLTWSSPSSSACLLTAWYVQESLQGVHCYGKQMSLRKTNDSYRRHLTNSFTTVYLEQYLKDHWIFLGNKRVLALGWANWKRQLIGCLTQLFLSHLDFSIPGYSFEISLKKNTCCWDNLSHELAGMSYYKNPKSVVG